MLKRLSKQLLPLLIPIVWIACDPGEVTSTDMDQTSGAQIITCDLQEDFSKANKDFEREIDEVLGNARSIITDSRGDFLYVLDDATKIIYRVDLSTGSHRLIYENADQSALHLLLDESQNRLYWVEYLNQLVSIDLSKSVEQNIVIQPALRVFEDDPNNDLAVEKIVGGSIDPTTGQMILSVYTPCCGASGSHRLSSFSRNSKDEWKQDAYLGTISDGSLRQSHFQYYPSSQSFHIRLRDTNGNSNKAVVFPEELGSPDSFQQSIDLSESNRISTAFRPMDNSFYITEAVLASDESGEIESLEEVSFFKVSEDGSKTNLSKCHAPSIFIEETMSNSINIVDHVYLDALDMIVGKSGIAFDPATQSIRKFF